MNDLDEGQFLDLLYGAAVDHGLWIPVMERFADMIGGVSGWLSQLDLVNGGGGGIVTRIDPEMVGLYEAHFGACNCLNNVPDAGAYSNGWSARILTDEDWMPKEELLQTEYYNDFLKPQDMHSNLMMRLALRGSEISALNITRPQARGPFERADLDVAAYFHPHIVRAFEMSGRFAAEAVTTADLLDRSADGLFLLDARGRVLRMNRVGDALVRAGSGLSVVGGRLCATGPAAQRLERLIAAAAHSEAARRRSGSMAIHLADRRLPLSLTVAPLGSSRLAFPFGEATVVACATDLEADVAPPERWLSETFGLTRAEARVALAVFHGAGKADAAAALGVSVHTVHAQLARVFEKTGAKRQSDLARIMMRGATSSVE